MTLDEAIKHCLEVAEQNEAQAEKIGRQLIGSAIDKYATDCQECAADHRQLAEWLRELKKLREENIAEKYDRAKELLKLTIDTNYNPHKSCYNCSHFTSDRNCDIGKYFYGTGEKECEWEWKHMGEIINFLHD